MRDDDRGTYREGDYIFGSRPDAPGITIDVDGDGEVTATVQNGVWRSDDQELANYLNGRAQELNIKADDTLAADARIFLGINRE